MNQQIYQDALDQAAKKMAHDIDTELLMSLLGWNRIEVSDGKILGSHYNTAKPVYDDGAYAITGRSAKWDKAVEWCVEQFGPTRLPWQSNGKLERWYVNNSIFWFKNEEDLTLFLLRWA